MDDSCNSDVDRWWDKGSDEVLSPEMQLTKTIVQVLRKQHDNSGYDGVTPRERITDMWNDKQDTEPDEENFSMVDSVTFVLLVIDRFKGQQAFS